MPKFMTKYLLAAAAFTMALVFSPESAVQLDFDTDHAEAGFGGRGGGGRGARSRGGGGRAAHRGGGGYRAKSNRRPSGAKTHNRTRPKNNAANRPSTRPATKPGGGNKPNRPEGGNKPNRPEGGNRPNRPEGGNRPNRPDRPNAGNRPNRPGYAHPGRPGRPGARPPGYRPPHYRPPHWRPPGWRPPYYRPPYVRGPHYHWGSYYWTPYWGWYFTAAVAGATVAFVATLPDNDCEEVLYENETLYECNGVLYRSTLQDDERVYEIVSSEEESQQAAPASTTAPAATDEEGPLLLTSPYMRGNRVRAVQQSLQALGYDVGTVDGVFGDGTDRAIRAFQADQGLPVTGVAAGETMTQLGL